MERRSILLTLRQIRSASVRPGLYQRAKRECRKQFTVTIKELLHTSPGSPGGRSAAATGAVRQSLAAYLDSGSRYIVSTSS